MATQDHLNGPDFDPDEEERILKERKQLRKMRRKKEEGGGPGEGEMNLTALMDVLTIMLVFLLKNYSTSPVVNLSSDLKPPESNSTIELKEAIAVTVTRNDISVDEDKVVVLQNGVVSPNDKVKDAPLLIGPLRDALAKKVDYHKMIEGRGGAVFKGEMLLVGDKSIDYELLSSVLYTAGQAQLANYRFVTISY